YGIDAQYIVIDARHRVVHPLELWRDTELLRPGARHHDQRRPGVVDARGVARRHAAAISKRRLEPGERLSGGSRSRVLVEVGDQRVALALWNGDRQIGRAHV